MFDWLGRLLRGRWLEPRHTAVSRCRRESSQVLAASRTAQRKLEASIAFLAQAAADQETAYRQLEEQYLAKVNELKQCDDLLLKMSQVGYTEKTCSLVSLQRQLEKALPDMKAAVESGHRQRQAIQTTLQQLRSKLRYQHGMLRKLHQQSVFNRAEAARLDGEFAVRNASQHLEHAQQALLQQQDELQSLRCLSKDETATLLAAINRLENHSSSRHSTTK
ncbi:MAG: hypothetical protein AAGB19_12530 [Cyanobacteria bacterium P01_F01_bin.3]